MKGSVIGIVNVREDRGQLRSDVNQGTAGNDIRSDGRSW